MNQLVILASIFFLAASLRLREVSSCDQMRNAEISELKGNLATFRESIEDAQSEMAHLTDKSSNLQDRIKTSTAAVLNDNDRIDKAVKNVKRLNVLLQEKTENAKKAQEAYMKAALDLNATEEQTDVLESKIKSIQQDFEAVNKEESDIYIKLSMLGTDVDNFNKSVVMALQSETGKEGEVRQLDAAVSALHQGVNQASKNLNDTRMSLFRAKEQVAEGEKKLKNAENSRDLSVQLKRQLEHKNMVSSGEVHFGQQQVHSLFSDAETLRTGELIGAKTELEQSIADVKLVQKKFANAVNFQALLLKAKGVSEWEEATSADKKIGGSSSNASVTGTNAVLQRSGDETDISDSEYAASEVLKKAQQMVEASQKVTQKHLGRRADRAPFNLLQLEARRLPKEGEGNGVEYAYISEDIDNEFKNFLSDPSPKKVNSLSASQLEELNMNINLHLHSANVSVERLAEQQMVAIMELKEASENSEKNVQKYLNLVDKVRNSSKVFETKQKAAVQFKSDLQDKDAEVGELESQVSALNKVLEHFQTVQQSQLSVYNKKLADLQQISEQANSAERAYGEAGGSLKTAQKDLIQCKSELQSAMDKFGETRRQYKLAGEKQKGIQRKLDELGGDHSRQEEAEEQRRQDLHARHEDLDRADDQTTDVTTSLVQAVSTLDTAKDAKARNKNELKRLNAEATSVENRISELNKKLKTFYVNQENIKKKVSEVSDRLGSSCEVEKGKSS